MNNPLVSIEQPAPVDKVTVRLGIDAIVKTIDARRFPANVLFVCLYIVQRCIEAMRQRPIDFAEALRADVHVSQLREIRGIARAQAIEGYLLDPAHRAFEVQTVRLGGCDEIVLERTAYRIFRNFDAHSFVDAEMVAVNRHIRPFVHAEPKDVGQCEVVALNLDVDRV